MPTPSDDETREEWMTRCIPVLVNEGNDQDQAVAICSSMWDKSMWDNKLLEEIELED